MANRTKRSKPLSLITDWATLKREEWRGTKGFPRPSGTYRGARRNASLRPKP